MRNVLAATQNLHELLHLTLDYLPNGHTLFQDASARSTWLTEYSAAAILGRSAHCVRQIKDYS